MTKKTVALFINRQSLCLSCFISKPINSTSIITSNKIPKGKSPPTMRFMPIKK